MDREEASMKFWIWSVGPFLRNIIKKCQMLLAYQTTHTIHCVQNELIKGRLTCHIFYALNMPSCGNWESFVVFKSTRTIQNLPYNTYFILKLLLIYQRTLWLINEGTIFGYIINFFPYRWANETKEWKERGIGDFKILKNKQSHKVRFLMRREQVMFLFFLSNIRK